MGVGDRVRTAGHIVGTVMAIRARVSSAIAWLRQRPVVGGLIAAYARADGLRFTRWAAAIALFGYLSLFPLLVLAFITFGVLLENYPELRADVESYLQDTVPLLFDSSDGEPAVDIQEVAKATRAAGVISVLALVLAGLGWVDSSVEGVRRMLGAMRRGSNLVVAKAQDLAFLVGVGSLLVVALAGAVAAQSFSDSLLEWAGFSSEQAWLVNLFAWTISALLIWVVHIALYSAAWWRRPRRRWRTVLVGALAASAASVALAQLSFLIVGRTLTNPVYGTLAVAAALLLFLYLASAVMLYFAAWVAVADGAPQTQEELAYAERTNGGDIRLPTV
jgi:membrane protein